LGDKLKEAMNRFSIFCVAATLWQVHSTVASLVLLDTASNAGQPAKPGEFPYQTSIRSLDSAGAVHICSGTIVNNQWVLTAASCCIDRHAKDLAIVAGQIDLLKAEEGIQLSLVSRIDFNPYYDPSFLSDDLCLLQVANPFYWTDTVQPAALPEFHTPNPINLTGIVTGWDIQDLGDEPRLLMGFNATVVSNEACNDFFLGQMICADYPNDKEWDDCPGDIGGPFFNPVNQTLMGVVRMARGCPDRFDPNYPSVYTKVSHYINWINNITK